MRRISDLYAEYTTGPDRTTKSARTPFESQSGARAGSRWPGTCARGGQLLGAAPMRLGCPASARLLSPWALRTHRAMTGDLLRKPAVDLGASLQVQANNPA
jgi:hypothetical protein